MTHWQIVRMVLLMLLLGISSVAAYVFYEHELYFCMFFACLLVLALIVYVVSVYSQTTHRLLRMVESIRYNDFSLSFSGKRQGRMEKQLLEDINEVMTALRSRMSFQEERYRYFETLLDTVDTCMLVADKEGQVLWMNRAGVQDLCGYTIHQLEELKGLNTDFPLILETLQPGEVKVVRVYKEEFMQDMAVTVTEYSTNRETLRLINLKNIRSILEENEMEAWQKLVRVLTHEIMNSITPIISLSDTLCDRAVQQGMDEDSLVLQGMKTIHRRSKGLLGFVENYRKLSRLASPILAPVKVGDWLDDIKKLFPSSKVQYIYKVENENRKLMIDRSQMEQVLINLLKNASEACAEQPHPQVVVETAYQAEKQIFQLSVKDNGNGILPEVQDKIFIPFFTTKTTGSGIGLSLCKQIMTLHGGSIRVSSEVGKGSCFTLKLLMK
ncbi:MAG: GHKL domain-containing protein [Bacteroidaceae bacterium]|nr:GHKL domain-containing protein [Bacteroidaceae bacterium]